MPRKGTEVEDAVLSIQTLAEGTFHRCLVSSRAFPGYVGRDGGSKKERREKEEKEIVTNNTGVSGFVRHKAMTIGCGLVTDWKQE
ncbi:hypothetical protein TNCT_585661 [Trichonephila clavata]|uniref:Uncharacterized protein n=1 Tax=Trichonephila clavata TaxID=2740835 RepID=A0A8X6IP13_TRICU|nr:hypothetical protein TNCT_585661 [Trichonephila clavata]